MAKRRTRRSGPHPVYIVLIMVIALVIFTRHLHTTEAVALSSGAGLIVGVVIGYRRGSSRAVVIATPAPKRKTAATAGAPAKTPRIRYQPVSHDALLADLDEWSSACLDGRCGECSGKFNGRKCTHCNHPGARKIPGKDQNLGLNDDTPPF